MGDYIDQFGTATVAQGSGGKRKRVHVDDEDNGYVKDLMFTSDSTIGRRQLTKNQIYGSTTIAAAAALPLGDFDLNLVEVSGTGVTINTITSNIPKAYRAGKVITLRFEQAGNSVTDTALSGIAADRVALVGGNYSSGVGSTLTLIYSATGNGFWTELAKTATPA